jgi:hypothetical protein
MATAGSPSDPHRAGSAKRPQLRASFVGASLITLCLWIAAPTSASAIVGASYSGLDPACVTQSVRDDAVKIIGAAGDAAKGVGNEVDDTVEAVERAVGAAVSSGVPTPVGGPGGDNGPGEGNGGGGGPQPRGHDHASGPSGRPRTEAVGKGLRAAVVVPDLTPGVLSGPFIAREDVPDPSTGAGSDGDVGVGAMAADIGHRLALPLALLLALVVAFVLMQGRLDRADPRLHLASLDEEISRFR